jgi:hypothetical protein
VRSARSVFAIVAVTLGVLSTAVVTTASARTENVTITSLPSHVAQGGLQHLNAAVSKGSGTCSLKVRYANGKKQALGRKPVLGRHVAWEWQVPRAAAMGKAQARVSCPGAGVRTRTFKVTRRLVPATLAIAQSGFTQGPVEYGGGTTVSYGLKLVNRSPNEDASTIGIDVTLLDAAGNAVAVSNDIILGSIPAGATFYTGGYAYTNDSTVITHLSYSVTAGSTPHSSDAPPAITNLTVSDNADGTVSIDGTITNEASKDLSGGSTGNAAFFNQAGQIIGGHSDPLLFSDLPPGAHSSFDVTSLGIPQASAVSQVKFDVAPYYVNP